MKKFLIFLIIVAGIWVGLSKFDPKLLMQVEKNTAPFFEYAKNEIQNQFFATAPCAEPIPYKLGTFDKKFGISQAYFLDALTSAEAIWENPKTSIGKNLFVYSGNDTSANVLKINLVYDYRQEATSKLNSLGIVVQNNRASYDALKAKYDALKKQLAATPNVNEKNKIIDEINAMVVVLNRLVVTLNLSVDQYNSINVTRGESFEEGVYVTDGTNSHIDIYEFSNKAKLVRVLAHELGHSLGLDHVSDPKAIMYKLNQGTSQVLTKADLEALKAECKIK